MGWLYGSGCVALALAVAGCGTFVEAETATDGDGGSSETSGTTNATSLSTSGGTGTGSGGPGTTPVTSSSETSATDPTNTDPTSTSPTESESSGRGSTGPDPTTTGETGEETSDAESTGTGECAQADIEPNGDPENAVTQDLPDQFCGTPASTVDGTLLDGEDLDAFVYAGIWNCGDTNNPNHRVEVTGPVTACLFPLCLNGNATNTNCVAGAPTTVNGVAGCCSNLTAVADVNCENTSNETALGFILVESAGAVCTDYTLTYSVDNK